MSKCILCKKRYEGHGNNAQPLAEGLCCDKCNGVVIEARLKEVLSHLLLKGPIMAIGIGIGKSRYKQAQEIATNLAEEVNKGKKAEIWVCHRIDLGFTPGHPGIKRGRCEHCGEPICYDDELKKNMTKNVKKICRVCILNVKKYSKNIDPRQLKLLEDIYGK